MEILIVDDSRAARLLARRSLVEAGFGGHDLTEADSGPEALRMIRYRRPHVVLADFNMPGMDGLELLQLLKEEGVQLTYALLTVDATSALRRRAMAAGASFCLVKPFTSEQLAECLGPLLETAP